MSVNDQIAHAPLPTDDTLRRRTSLVVQLWRFAWINLRMYKMVRMEHRAQH
jgi:hypothetical protein